MIARLALAALAACSPDTADVTLSEPIPCADGYTRGADGLCYALGDTAPEVDTGTEGDTAADTGTGEDTGGDTAEDTAAAPEDLDGDGYPSDVDCDDTRAEVYPGAPELCDGLDRDCDGSADAGALDAGAWFLDGDGDGYGDPGATVAACEAPAGSSAEAGDCDDTDPEINPAAPDDTADGVDSDCDGATDEDYDPCAGSYGWFSLPYPAWTFSDDERAVTLPVEGWGWICRVTCADAWITPEVGTEIYASCADAPASLPALASDGASLCLTARSPGVASSSTCEIYTSSGTLTVDVRWRM